MWYIGSINSRREPRTILPDPTNSVSFGPSKPSGPRRHLICQGGPISHQVRAIYPPLLVAPTLSLTAEPAPGSGEITAPAKMAASSCQRGYNPEEMAWSTISHAGNEDLTPAKPIPNENLFRLVERRSQRRKAKMTAATAQAAPGKQLPKQQAPASRGEKGKAKPAWRPKPLLQKFDLDDFVVVLKPRTALAL